MGPSYLPTLPNYCNKGRYGVDYITLYQHRLLRFLFILLVLFFLFALFRLLVGFLTNTPKEKKKSSSISAERKRLTIYLLNTPLSPLYLLLHFYSNTLDNRH